MQSFEHLHIALVAFVSSYTACIICFARRLGGCGWICTSISFGCSVQFYKLSLQALDTATFLQQQKSLERQRKREWATSGMMFDLATCWILSDIKEAECAPVLDLVLGCPCGCPHMALLTVQVQGTGAQWQIAIILKPRYVQRTFISLCQRAVSCGRFRPGASRLRTTLGKKMRIRARLLVSRPHRHTNNIQGYVCTYSSRPHVQ